MVDFSRYPFISPKSSSNQMRHFNIIPERFPPYLSKNSLSLYRRKEQLLSIISSHWDSSHHVFPLLKQESFGSMVEKFLEKHKDSSVSAETVDETPFALKALLFAVAALSARYNRPKDEADFYYFSARAAISASEDVHSFEFLLASTILVCLSYHTNVSSRLHRPIG